MARMSGMSGVSNGSTLLDLKDKSNEQHTQNTQHTENACELRCSKCGKRFIVRRGDSFTPVISVTPIDPTSEKQRTFSHMCYTCIRKERKQREEEKARIESEQWQQQKAQEYEEFLRLLPLWNVVPLEKILSQDIVPNQVLYIIGNGFDLMHCVPSSYYSFRDSLGKNSLLRSTLETFWTTDDPRDDVWADFENALAKFNAEAMCSSFMIDNYLDIYDAYDEDAGAAEFYMAAEASVHPMITVANELPKRFRQWVNTLKVGTEDKPLQSLFCNGASGVDGANGAKVLNFNYTEFVEDIYDIPEENVCYIHGCRRKKKYHPAEPLILGHQPGASDEAFDFDDRWPWGTKKHSRNPYKDPYINYKNYLLESAQEQAIRLVNSYDGDLTKHSTQIIEEHRGFFDNLDAVQNVVVIGHSLSPVDWEYFHAVADGLQDKNAVHWYFSCHGLRDLQNIEKLMDELELTSDMVSIFRTDTIKVTPKEVHDSASVEQKIEVGSVPTKSSMKSRQSSDKQWIAEYCGGNLKIIESRQNCVDYETNIKEKISEVYFTPNDKHLLVIIREFESGILLFNLENNHWHFVDELKGIPNQGIMNRRLCKVCLNGRQLAFVYRSRVRVYNLDDGSLIKNKQVQKADQGTYKGIDISNRFIR